MKKSELKRLVKERILAHLKQISGQVESVEPDDMDVDDTDVNSCAAHRVDGYQQNCPNCVDRNNNNLRISQRQALASSGR